MVSTTPPSSIKEKASDLDTDPNNKEKELSNSLFNDSQSGSNQVPDLAPDTSPAAEEDEWVTGIKLFTIMTAICLVCVLLLLDTSIIVTAIPQITSDFHSLPDVGWYGAAYQLSRYDTGNYFCKAC